jgi:hypothetical protein
MGELRPGDDGRTVPRAGAAMLSDLAGKRCGRKLLVRHWAPPRILMSPPASTGLVDAGGTMWRLRSLVAMGHDTSRTARALRARPRLIRDLVRGDVKAVSPQLRGLACQLWDAWWTSARPNAARAECRAATRARHRAKASNWCPPLGLDEEYRDEPGYRPYSIYRPATRTGVAADFVPVNGRPDVKEIA